MSGENSPAVLRTPRMVIRLSISLLLLSLLFNSLAMTLRPGLTTFIIWMVQILPIALFIPGILKDHLRTHAWLCFVTLTYFIHGVLVAFSPDRMLVGAAETFATIMLFTSLLIYIRRFRQHYQVGL